MKKRYLITLLMLIKSGRFYLISFSLILFHTSCNKMLDVGSPTTSTNATIVYNTDAVAISAVTGIFSSISNVIFSTTPTFGNLSLYASLSADDLTLYSGATGNGMLNTFYINMLNSNSNGGEFWNTFYNLIFNANGAIEGINASTALSSNVRQQLLGEAKFIRALCYFYLVSLYGDVPLVLSTDYKINSKLSRMNKSNIYTQIIIDLKEAQTELSSNFLNASLNASTTERVRPTKWAATALLARTYLFNHDWANAEIQTTQIISNTTLFSPATLAGAFLKNSTDAIWQLQPVRTGENTPDARMFILPASGPTINSANPVYLSQDLLNTFETGDLRKSNWIASVTPPGGVTFAYPYKYKLSTTTASSVSEYIMVLRLAEQYLIRSEARAMQSNILGSNSAQSDLNVVRNRAGLGATNISDQEGMLKAILHERRVEFFTEWGHRWLDLKRTETIDDVMSAYTPIKGGTWDPNWAYYPISSSEIQKNNNLVQNPGYN